jgi:hypothetical protein
MQRLVNQFCLDGDVEDVADGEKDGTNKSEDGDKDKQIPEDNSAKDPKPQDDSITEDIDFSILDRMKKFNPTKSILPFPSSPAGTVVVASSLQLETRNTSPSSSKQNGGVTRSPLCLMPSLQPTMLMLQAMISVCCSSTPPIQRKIFRTSKLSIFVRKPTL